MNAYDIQISKKGSKCMKMENPKASIEIIYIDR